MRAPLLPRTVEPSEVVSLTERLAHLQLLRVLMVLVAIAGTRAGFDTADDARDLLDIAAVAYLGATALAELARRSARRWDLASLSAMLLVDGLFLAWITYVTGGTQSPLRFLVFVHLVAVTLLASYRSGLKIALWHSLLSLVVLYAQAAELLVPRESAPGVVPRAGEGLEALPVFNVTAFLVVALVTACFSALNERELRRRRADSEALAAMATEMERLEGPDAIAQTLLAALGEGLGFGRGAVLVERDGLSVLAHRGTAPLPPDAGGLDPVLADAAARRAPVLLKSAAARRNPALAALLPGARRVVVLPLFADGHLVGAVALEYAGGQGWSIERRLVSVAAQLAAYGALALRNAWLVERIRQMATTDGLTGLANRRAFDAALARELGRARRESASVSLALLDVDHFKDYNDRHGHVAGDEALQALARALDEKSRGHDVIARYGGEEFAVILPGCPQDDSLRLAERIRDAARSLRLAAPITVSVGVSTFPDDALEADALVAAADQALYVSKHTGRDRATAAGHEQVRNG